MGAALHFQYKAFISYSHKDGRWAQWLLNALETYRLPSAKTRGVGRIFRDRDEAGAATDLKDEIQRALLASEHLIVIASPRSARSKYVQSEIEFFAAQNAGRSSPGRILTLIVDGEPNVTGPGEPDPRECFPPALRGGLTKSDGLPFEPLAADARPVGDGRTRALAKLVAGLMDLRYDTLVRRDLVRQRRVQLVVAASTLSGLIIAVIASWMIVAGNIERDRLAAEREATLRESRALVAVSRAEEARRRLEAGDVEGAVALARESLTTDGSLPFIPQAFSVLYGALFRSSEVMLEIASGEFYDPPPTWSLGDGSYLTLSSFDGAVIWSPNAGVTYRRDDLALPVASRTAGEGAIFMTLNSALLRLRVASKSWDTMGLGGVEIDEDLSGLVGMDETHVVLCGKTVSRFSVPETGVGPATLDWRRPVGDAECTSVARSSAGTILAGTSSGYVVELDQNTGDEIRRYETARTDDPIFWVTESDGKHLIASGIDQGAVFDRQSGERKLEISWTGGDNFLSPNGRLLAEPFRRNASDELYLTVHDLDEPSKSVDVRCACMVGDFLDDTRLFVTAGQQVSLMDVETGMLTEVASLSVPPDRMRYLDDQKLLVIFRQGHAEIIVPLDPATTTNRLLDGGDDGDDILTAAYFVGEDDVAVRLGFLKDSTDPYRWLRFRRGPDGKGVRVGEDGLDQTRVADPSFMPEDLPADPILPSSPFTQQQLAKAYLRANHESLLLYDGDGAPLLRISVGRSRLSSILYVAQRGWIVAGFENGRLLVWHANAAAAPLIDIQAHGREVSILKASPSGTQFLSADENGTLRIWPIFGVSELLERTQDL